MYCGNNALKAGVRFGTRYECLKKGIGVGIHAPVDPEYNGPYEPIDKTRIYCGTKKRLPGNYDRMGSPTDCLRKGVGIGKRISAKRSRKASRKGSRRPGGGKKKSKKKSKKRSKKKSKKKSKKSRKARNR